MTSPLIAVIDRSEAFRTFVAELLADEGYRIVDCATTCDALDLVARARPDVVILDLWIERRDAGWELLERMRRDPRTAFVPILVCSGDPVSIAKHADLLRCWGCPVVQKPFDLDQLLAHIAAMTVMPRVACLG